MEAVPGKADEERDTALAKRLARAMGTEIVRRAGGFELDGFPDVGWEDDEEILRGGLGVAGLLDLGKVWECDGLSLPAGVGPASSDEEIDLVLSAMGF